MRSTLVLFTGLLLIATNASAQQTTAPVRSHPVDGRVIRDPGIPGNYNGALAERGQAIDRALLLRLSKPSTDYRLGAGDLINIEIIGQDEMSKPLQNLRIPASGLIPIPYLGDVRAEGLTALELEQEIRDLLAQRQLITNPDALVYIVDYQAKPIYIVGEVDNPGEYVMSQQMTLTEAILMAGGMEQTGEIDLVAARYGYLHRKTSSEAPDWRPEPAVANPAAPRPGREVIEVDLEPLRKGGVLSPDIPLRKGDVFIVPKRDAANFYLIGDVRAPGQYQLPGPDTRSLLLTQAVAQAGGTNKSAKLSKGLVVRNENGKRIEMPFDLKAVLKGRQPDILIKANDIIFIPGSKIRGIQQGLVGIAPSAAQRRVTNSTIGRP